MSSALIVALTSATYLLFGVTEYTNTISDLEQQCAQGIISEEQKLAEISDVISELQEAGIPVYWQHRVQGC